MDLKSVCDLYWVACRDKAAQIDDAFESLALAVTSSTALVDDSIDDDGRGSGYAHHEVDGSLRVSAFPDGEPPSRGGRAADDVRLRAVAKHVGRDRHPGDIGVLDARRPPRVFDLESLGRFEIEPEANLDVTV